MAKKLLKKYKDKNFLILLAGTAVVILSGFIFYQKSVKVKKYQERLRRAIFKPVTLQVPLLEQNNSGLTGNAVVTEYGNKIYVSVGLTGDASGLAKPLGIYNGTCRSMGSEVFKLANVVRGESLSAPLNLRLSELSTLMPLSIGVKGSTTSTTTVVCGNLSL